MYPAAGLGGAVWVLYTIWLVDWAVLATPADFEWLVGTSENGGFAMAKVVLLRPLLPLLWTSECWEIGLWGGTCSLRPTYTVRGVSRSRGMCRDGAVSDDFCSRDS